MPDRSGRSRGRLAARVLIATGAVDRAYRWFDRLRSELVAALVSNEVLDRYNEYAYGGTPSYKPSSGGFREFLFPFEETVIERFFPSPPARILLGGAGGGREALALASRGYRVVAFEPAASLVEELKTAEPSIEIHRGAYDDMDQLFPIETTEPFDAAIAGWGSFSHLRGEGARIETLQALARRTTGPILVSFLAVRGTPTGRTARLRRLLPRRSDRDPGDVFATGIGLYHPVEEEEVRALAQVAGVRILHLSFDERETSWPHVVLQRES